MVSRDQLLAHDVSGSTISRWEAAGWLHRLYPRVYAFGHRALEYEGRLRAALMHAGPGAALSHLTAAAWWALTDDEPARVHVSASTPRPSARGLVLHQPREIEQTVHRGLPVTTVRRTLLDMAPLVPFRRLRRALAEAEYRRLVDIRDIASILGRGRPGSRALKRAVTLHEPRLARTLSELEERFLALCERHGIPTPEVNVKVCGLMVDALWRERRVVVELDGRQAHSTAAAMERDRARDLTLRAAGHAVLRYTWEQVTRQEQLVATDLRRGLGLELTRITPKGWA